MHTEPPPLEPVRHAIDAVDTELLALLARRLRLAHEARATRTGVGGPPVDPAREAAVVRRAATLAREHGLEPEVVRDIFWRIIELSHRSTGPALPEPTP